MTLYCFYFSVKSRYISLGPPSYMTQHSSFCFVWTSCLWLHGKIYLWHLCFAWSLDWSFHPAWISMEWEQSVWTLAMWASALLSSVFPNPKLVSCTSLWVSEMSLCSPSPGISAAGDNWAFTLYETSKEIETLWMIHCRGFACVPPKDVEVLTPSFSECNWR